MDTVDTAAPAEQPLIAEIGDTTDTYTSPLGSQIPDKEPVIEEKPLEPSKTPREAIQKALDKAKEQAPTDDKPKVEIKAPEKPVEPVKPADQVHKDALKAPEKPIAPVDAKQPETIEQPKVSKYEAPTRFHDIAKQDWNTVPESVRAEVHRGFTELENGLTKYREGHEKYEALREYDDLAVKHGTNIKEALTNYTGIERMLHDNPIKALEQIISNVSAHKGWRNPDGSPLTFRDVAGHYLNMPADQVASRTDSTIQQMNQQIAHLSSVVGNITETAEQHKLREAHTAIADFTKEHPRTEELADDIALLIQAGRASNLKDAYDLADRMNPSTQAPLIQTQENTAAHTREERPVNAAALKSVTGAPSAGSDPETAGKPSSSIREALKKAARKAQ